MNKITIIYDSLAIIFLSPLIKVETNVTSFSVEIHHSITNTQFANFISFCTEVSLFLLAQLWISSSFWICDVAIYGEKEYKLHRLWLSSMFCNCTLKESKRNTLEISQKEILFVRYKCETVEINLKLEKRRSKGKKIYDLNESSFMFTVLWKRFMRNFV